MMGSFSTKRIILNFSFWWCGGPNHRIIQESNEFFFCKTLSNKLSHAHASVMIVISLPKVSLANPDCNKVTFKSLVGRGIKKFVDIDNDII